MNKDNDKISNYQLAVIVILTSISVGIFSLPAELTKIAGNNAYIIVLLSMIPNGIMALTMVKLGAMFKGKNLPELCNTILGKWPGKLITTVFALILLYNTAVALRTFTEVLRLFILFKTPTIAMIIPFVLVCAYLVNGGVEIVGRFFEITFILLFIPLIILLILGLRNSDVTNLMPFLYGASGKMKVILPTIIFSLGGFSTIICYIGFVKEPKKAYKSMTLAVLFTTVFVAFTVAACIIKFGVVMTSALKWPVINYIRGSNQTGLFMESLDGILILFWSFMVFTTVVANYFIISYFGEKIFEQKTPGKMILPTGILICLLSFILQDMQQMSEKIKDLRVLEVILLTYGLPILLMTVAKIRHLGGQQ